MAALFLRCILIIAAVLGSRPIASAADAAEPPRPNIVLIMADDMGYECVGANGGTSYSTPHLDQLARTGMRFEHCHVQPLCTPTRVQLMTGISNHRNYIRFGILDPHALTFGHMFKEAGYATVVAGKWQLQGGFEGPNRFGFDEYCLWQLTRRPPRHANPGLEINGKQVDYSAGEYGPDLVSDYLCDFIRRHKDQPFFAYYPMILPHAPYEPTPDLPEYNKSAPTGRKEGKGRPKFFAPTVAYTDKMVGKIIACLDELQLRERTLVIFTGDNGTGKGTTSQMGDRTVTGGKGSTKDTGTHVPLIVNRPGHVPEGVVNSDLVGSVDFVPTILDIAGIARPENIVLDGQSFAPQLRGEAGEPRRWLYSWYQQAGLRDGSASEHVRTQRHKLYRDGRFFDVVADPDEQSPLNVESLPKPAVTIHDELRQALAGISVPAEPEPGPRP